MATTGWGQQVRIGVKGGGNLSNGVGYDAQSSRVLLGWQAGALAQLTLTQHLGLQAEAQYALRGDNAVVYGPSIGHRLTYLDLPLLVQYRLEDVFMELGPRYSYLLSATPVGQHAASIGTQAFRPTAYGFAVGLGYQDPTGLQLGWRYTADLSNLYRTVDFGGSIGEQQTRLRNSSMQFYLGALFEPKQVLKSAVSTGKFTARSSKKLAIGTARLVFVKTPVLLFRGGKFLLYTGPRKLVRALGSLGKPTDPTPVTAPAPAAPPAPPASPQ